MVSLYVNFMISIKNLVLGLSKIHFFLISIREMFCAPNSPPSRLLVLGILQEIYIFRSDHPQICVIVGGRK